jgi:hypothetical protein
MLNVHAQNTLDTHHCFSYIVLYIMLLAGRKFSYIAQEGQQKMGVARNIHISSLAKFAQKGLATQGFKNIFLRKVDLKIF